MPLSARDVVSHYQTNKTNAERVLAAHQELLATIEAARSRVAPTELEARKELAHAYLPDLTPAAIARLERLTGFRGLTRRDPIAAQARERKVLNKAIERIRHDTRYVRRQYLVGSEGEITRALAEAQDMLDPWELTVKRFEELDGFMELVGVGYDTPSFENNFWEARYWKRWAMGDRICEAVDMDDFGDDVLPAWREAVAKRDPWRVEVTRIAATVQDVHDLVQEHDQAVARVPRLPQIYLDGSVGVVAEFLATADFALLDEWIRSEDNRPVRMGLRRAAGLKAKLDVLDELAQGGIAPAIEALQQRIAKFQRKIVKYSRGKYAYTTFPDTAIDSKFEAKVPKLLERPAKLGKLVGRIERYDDYERFDMDQPQELWFTEFTGRRPSFQFPRLRQWYDSQPDAVVVHDERESSAQAVAAAAGARELDDVGYLS